MSQSSARSALFLQEMGVGVQWKLRNAPESDGFAEAVQALADGDVVEAPAPIVMAPQPVVSEPGVFQPNVSQTERLPVAPVAERPAPPASPAAAPTDDDSTAWFDDAPAPAPAAAPASRPAPPRPAPAPVSRTASEAPAPEEDTAWFDDAPMPPPTAAAAQRPAAEPAHADPARAHRPVAEPALPAGPVSDEAIAQMDWPALRAAVSSCTRCTLCETRIAAVNGRGAENATWIAFAAAPSSADEQDVQAVTGEAGQLLHNMLKAIELTPESDVYVTNVVKCRPPERNPSGEEVVACRPYLDRELALTGATMAMTFGQFAAKGLMMGPAARGQVMRYKQLQVVATYHPDDLLRKPEDKAKAWADLCLAKASHA